MKASYEDLRAELVRRGVIRPEGEPGQLIMAKQGSALGAEEVAMLREALRHPGNPRNRFAPLRPPRYVRPRRDSSRAAVVGAVALAAGAVASFALWRKYQKPEARPRPSPSPPPQRADIFLPRPAALVWLGPANLSQVKGAELAGVPSFALTCTGDGSPSCGQIADAWLESDAAAAAAFADRWKGADGRRLPAMRRALKLPGGPVMLAAYSAGGHAVRRLLQHPADRAEIVAVYLADGTYTTEWQDKRAGKAAPIREFVEYALEAARGEHVFIATASSSPNKTHPTGAQTLHAIRRELEARGVRGSTSPLALAGIAPNIPPEPERPWRAGRAALLDFGSAFAHGSHATEIAPRLLPFLVSPAFAGVV